MSFPQVVHLNSIIVLLVVADSAADYVAEDNVVAVIRVVGLDGAAASWASEHEGSPFLPYCISRQASEGCPIVAFVVSECPVEESDLVLGVVIFQVRHVRFLLHRIEGSLVKLSDVPSQAVVANCCGFPVAFIRNDIYGNGGIHSVSYRCLYRVFLQFILGRGGLGSTNSLLGEWSSFGLDRVRCR